MLAELARGPLLSEREAALSEAVDAAQAIAIPSQRGPALLELASQLATVVIGTGLSPARCAPLKRWEAIGRVPAP